MATESPIRMPSHQEAASFAPSTPSMAVEDLVLLRKGQRLRGSSRDVAPHRSGSAPPSMEGSLLAINNLMSQQNSNLNIGSYSKVNLNPRLYTPPVPRESRHTGHHTGRGGSNWDRSSSYLHLSQATLSTHEEETGDVRLLEQPSADLVEGADRFWSAEDTDSFVGQSKSLVALIQEDFPRTPSPVYNQSQSLSSGTTDDAADHDTSNAASSPDTNIMGMSLNADLSTHSSSSSVNCAGAAQLSTHSLNLNSESVLESQMKELNISSLPNSKETKNQEHLKNSHQSNMAQHQHQNNAFHNQASKSPMGLQGVNSYIGIDQFPQAPLKLAAEAQQVLQSSALYANATGYIASPNPHYPSVQVPGVYSPQYGVGGYALNSAGVPPFVSVYPPHGTVPMVFDGSIGPSFNARMPGISSRGTMAQGVDMQHFNRSYGHLQYAMQQSVSDPAYVQYYQQLYSPAYGISGQFNPMSGTALAGNQNSGPDLKRGSEVPSALDNQKMLHQRSGINNLNQGGGAVINHHYYGSQQNMGILMQYPPSPISSPVLPESPMARTGTSGGRNDIRFPVATNRYAAVYPGWQGQRILETSTNPAIYNFLEELKSGKGRKFDLSDISGHIVEFSADQHGSRFIQQKLENCSAEDKASVFKEVLPCASKLITDVFGNYVIQKFFEYGSPDQRKELAGQLTGQILPLSLQMYGCRVIQKALDVIELDQKAQLIRELDGHVMRCVRDQNGNHVIQKCIESLPTEKIGFIISSFRGEVATLSMHPYGCRVVQRVLEHCTDEIQCQFIVDEILDSIRVLAQDQYGNYVTQHVLQRGRSRERYQIISKLSGHIVQLSQHKFASNVIEKCLEYGGNAERELIIEEILGQNEGNDNLLVMMKDQFANYVVQKILDMCTESQRATLLNRIRSNAHALKKYTYGKHIVARFEQQFGEDDETSET